MTAIHILTDTSPYWKKTAHFAEQCGWEKGVELAAAMRENCFYGRDRVICACVDQKVVGFCTFTAHPNHLPLRGYLPLLDNLFVAEEYRQWGIGERMLRVVLDYAGELGEPQIYISGKRMDLFDKCGCVNAGTILDRDHSTMHLYTCTTDFSFYAMG